MQNSQWVQLPPNIDDQGLRLPKGQRLLGVKQAWHAPPYTATVSIQHTLKAVLYKDFIFQADARPKKDSVVSHGHTVNLDLELLQLWLFHGYFPLLRKTPAINYIPTAQLSTLLRRTTAQNLIIGYLLSSS